MKKVVSMLMALIMAFTMGPVVVARAENGTEDKVSRCIAKIDAIEQCISDPENCDIKKTPLVNKVCGPLCRLFAKPIFVRTSKLIRWMNYAWFFREVDITDLVKLDAKDDPRFGDLLKLAGKDAISFSQMCDFLRAREAGKMDATTKLSAKDDPASGEWLELVGKDAISFSQMCDFLRAMAKYTISSGSNCPFDEADL